MSAIALLPPPPRMTATESPLPGIDAAWAAHDGLRGSRWRLGGWFEPFAASADASDRGVGERTRGRPGMLEAQGARRTGAPLGLPTAPFMAQHIAQEVLSAGLYREAWDVGALAYAKAAGQIPGTGAELRLAV